LKKLGKVPNFSLTNSWEVYADHFCIIDKETLDLYWPKYTNLEYRWLRYEPFNLEELTFREWFNLYSGLENKKYRPEHFLIHGVNKKPVILSRTACLGSSILDKINLCDITVQNHQKSRIDYILDCSNDSSYSVKPEIIQPYIIRNDVHEVITQSKNNFLGYSNVKMLIMDSFSELTDKLFIANGNEWGFCSHYSDVNHNTDFNQKFICKGLIASNTLKSIYINFFDKIKNIYGDIPILFIHFPTKFDKRPEYKYRSEIIIDILSDLSNRNYNLHSVTIDNNNIYQHDSDNFCYHFSASTIDSFANKILELNLLDLTTKK
jgi:hypothetical protein